MKKYKKIAIPIMLIALAGLFFLVKFKKPEISGFIMVSGNIEVKEVQLGFKIPGQLKERKFDEGDTVAKNQMVALLDSKDQELAVSKVKASLSQAEAFLAELVAGSRPEEIERAKARVLQAQYTLDELKNGSRLQEIEDAQAELDRTMASYKASSAQFAQAKADYERFEAMHKQGGVSLRDFELYSTKYDTAKNAVAESEARIKSAKARLSLRKEGAKQEEIKRARASLKQAEAEYNIVKNGPRKETIDQAKAQVEAAKESFGQAKQQLEYTKIFSPIDGIVLSKSSESGEYLNIGSTVMTVGDVKHPWLRGYISEKDLGRIKIGSVADVTTDSFPGKVYQGRVSFISSQAEFTPKAVQTFEERIKLMYRIKIDLLNKNFELKPGMPADARIKTEG